MSVFISSGCFREVVTWKKFTVNTFRKKKSDKCHLAVYFPITKFEHGHCSLLWLTYRDKRWEIKYKYIYFYPQKILILNTNIKSEIKCKNNMIKDNLTIKRTLNVNKMLRTCMHFRVKVEISILLWVHA